ncbi:hypothetical protein PAXRUDRAFT_261809 [Paxillus rubicundulus Ve08.2h10]|uniref:Uncharacterized protein n=1 Tax=Paxillus rubicundulus Ve08.2h10 TaxID=930991 RepID=A0A0D0DGG2_9AGAM|nr:hypothetical protein PAXRUDRAFT_261809 [Paxillus rubicundulus Ve08.2h10]
MRRAIFLIYQNATLEENIYIYIYISVYKLVYVRYGFMGCTRQMKELNSVTCVKWSRRASKERAEEPTNARE